MAQPFLRVRDIENLLQSSNIHIPWDSHLKSRREQNQALVDAIISRAFSFLPPNINQVDNDHFFIGAVDLMVSKNNGKNQFHVLEINGGSTRGLWSLTERQIEILYEGYLETLNFTPSPKQILIGHLDYDTLLYEKLLLKNRFIHNGRVPAKNIIMKPYSQLISNLSSDTNYIFYKNQPVDIVIGDGISRRMPQFFPSKNLKTIIINKIHPITDSKVKTYQAISKHKNQLKKLSCKTLKFWEANNEQELMEMVNSHIDDVDSLVIKPNNSSGGCGIEFINQKWEISNKIYNSQQAYQNKFGSQLSPFPYLITEKINPLPVNNDKELKIFDIKIHLARKGNRILPVGGKFRFSKNGEKVTNLTSDGRLTGERALGINKNNLELLGITQDDLAKCFAISLYIVSHIAREKLEIVF